MANSFDGTNKNSLLFVDMIDEMKLLLIVYSFISLTLSPQFVLLKGLVTLNLVINF
jgi:hypothetical protein